MAHFQNGTFSELEDVDAAKEAVKAHGGFYREEGDGTLTVQASSDVFGKISQAITQPKPVGETESVQAVGIPDDGGAEAAAEEDTEKKSRKRH